MIKINSFHFIVAASLKCNRKVDAFTHFRFLFIVFDVTSSGGSPAAEKENTFFGDMLSTDDTGTRVPISVHTFGHGWMDQNGISV